MKLLIPAALRAPRALVALQALSLALLVWDACQCGDADDAAVLQRALELPLLAPGIAPVCAAATP